MTAANLFEIVVMCTGNRFRSPIVEYLLRRSVEGLPVHVRSRSEEHTSELQSHHDLVCRPLLEKKNNTKLLLYLQTKKKKNHTKVSYIDFSYSYLLIFFLIFFYVTSFCFFFFFFNDTATTEIYTLSLHDALPITICRRVDPRGRSLRADDRLEQ